MSIYLNGILLPDLLIDNRFADTGIAGESERALAGNLIVFEREISGQAMDLVGGNDIAPIQFVTLNQVMALAKVLGAQYNLNYDGTITRVRFRHEDVPVISAEPIQRVVDPEDSAWFKNVRLKFSRI